MTRSIEGVSRATTRDGEFEGRRPRIAADNDLPKIENLKRLFPDYYSERPVLVAGK